LEATLSGLARRSSAFSPDVAEVDPQFAQRVLSQVREMQEIVDKFWAIGRMDFECRELSAALEAVEDCALSNPLSLKNVIADNAEVVGRLVPIITGKTKLYEGAELAAELKTVLDVEQPKVNKSAFAPAPKTGNRSAFAPAPPKQGVLA
jgi:hypothetical protein